MKTPIQAFGQLLKQYRLRKPKLTQKRLAELAGYDQAILIRMSKGGKDLSGPSGRDRVLRLIETLAELGAIQRTDEANALLRAATMPPLFEAQPVEARILMQLGASGVYRSKPITNLPAEMTSFIGRIIELEALDALLPKSRLLTLVGPGGSGKTRLARRLGERAFAQFCDGVCYVELVAVIEPNSVETAVARALGISDTGMPAVEILCNHLRDRTLLLILDNCEHVIEAVAALTVRLLGFCRSLTILATSRESLNIEGEVVWRVPTMIATDAATLFAERACLSNTAPAIIAEDPRVAQICTRLDFIPLAIEMAAARMAVLSLEEIAARVDDRFALLSNKRRGVHRRHQTLRVVLDWSYNLLTPSEKVLFRRLSVFVGGWTLDLAEDVANDTDLPRDSILQALTSLVAKSLVQVDPSHGKARYSFLETVRQYASDLLSAGTNDEHHELQSKHAEALGYWVTWIEHRLRESTTRTRFAEIEREFPNITAALNWALVQQHNTALGCQIFAALQLFWATNTHCRDQMRWFDLARKHVRADMPPVTQAGLLLIDYNTMLDPVANQAMLARFYKARALYAEAGDAIGIAQLNGYIASLNRVISGAYMDANKDTNDDDLIRMRNAADETRRLGAGTFAREIKIWLGHAHSQSGMLSQAKQLFEEAIDECKTANDDLQLSGALIRLAELHLELLEFDAAWPNYEEAAEVAHRMSNSDGEVWAMLGIARCQYLLGQHERAVDLCHSILIEVRSRMPDYATWPPVITLSMALISCNQLVRALALLRNLLESVINQHGAAFGYYYNLYDALACIAGKLGQPVATARLTGAADRDRDAHNYSRSRCDSWEYALHTHIVRVAIGEAAYERHRQEGFEMSPQEANDYARHFYETEGIDSHLPSYKS